MCSTMQFVVQSKAYVRAKHYHHLAANSLIKDIINNLRYAKNAKMNPSVNPKVNQ